MEKWDLPKTFPVVYCDNCGRYITITSQGRGNPVDRAKKRLTKAHCCDNPEIKYRCGL